jgi:hypothetical protein
MQIPNYKSKNVNWRPCTGDVLYSFPRKTTPRVRDGKVQRKNRWAETPNCYNTDQPEPVIDRQRPGWGYRHLVRKEDVRRFIRLIPNWHELAVGLNVIILAEGDHDCFGWHRSGRVAICAWERCLSMSFCEADHAWFLSQFGIVTKLGVPSRHCEGRWEFVFTEDTARAFQLIHILIHELGHHHDRMTTRSKVKACRGEGYAEAYARRFEDLLLARYRNEFPL